VAFISNRSFLDKRTYDGFRAIVATEFNDIYILDLGGDVRDDPRLSGTTHNVFGIQIGVSISFMVKRSKNYGCRIHYARRPQRETKEEKLSVLQNTRLSSVAMDKIFPDRHHDWISQSKNDFAALLPIADQATKSVRVAGQERAIFRVYSLGISTNRDEWLYDLDCIHLQRKVQYFVDQYDNIPSNVEEFPNMIKWSETLKRRKRVAQREHFTLSFIRRANYRPFCTFWLYQSPLLIDRPGLVDTLFPSTADNLAICFTDPDAQKPWSVCSIDRIVDLHFVGSAAGAICLGRYRVVGRERTDNITDWALDQFRAHYEPSAASERPITKDAIFYYVYGVLHDPVYREKYALNLKREFPRIPFYADFWRWADWGERLMALHIGYEAVEPWPLSRTDIPDEKSRAAGLPPRPLLRADKSAGIVILDSETQLGSVPKEAWEYRLGNRSALEWVLDQHKEKTPKDPTIRERFNTYRFADHKERVIDLLRRVTRVSVETMAIVATMRSASDLRTTIG
jgi:predicted helicase